MNKLNNQSTLKAYKSGNYEYIYIYYKLNGNVIRINTKNQVKKNGMTSDLLYNTKVEDYKKKNDKTLQLKKLVDNYVRVQLEDFRPVVNQTNLEDILNDRMLAYKLSLADRMQYKPEDFEPKQPIIKTKYLNDYYQEFYNFKLIELNDRAGLKDYKSLQNALIDYQTYIVKELSLEEINSKEFILRFRNFLSIKHPEGYKTKGELNDNTISKRLSALKTFYKYAGNKAKFSFDSDLFEIEKQGFVNNVVTLSKEDLKLLKGLELPEFKQKVIDVFLMNCFLGLRFSDLKTLNEFDFEKDEKGNLYMKKENKKTGYECKVPVISDAFDILSKYDFNIPRWTNQYFNRELQSILKENELFEQVVIKKRRSLKANLDYQVLKRELITSHTARRTFITLCVNADMNIPAIMEASGHRKIQSIQLYIEKKQDLNKFKAIGLND